MAQANPNSEWMAYLGAYQAHLNNVRESLESGKITTAMFGASAPSTRLPRGLEQQARQLEEEGQELMALLKERMAAITTVLRYSRMKHPDRVVLVDVMA